mgnify:CR=1 FL=1
MEEMIKLWKELNVKNAEFEFDCGGDSMNNTDIRLLDKDGNLIENSELSDYFDKEVYKNVDFYVNSDGHYQGEFGIVFIALNEDEDEPYFQYTKSSSSQWSESYSGVGMYKLTEKEENFIKEKVDNINGSQDGFVINYKNDCILTDEEEKIVTNLEEGINNLIYEFTPEDTPEDGESEDWFTFTTNEDGEQLTITNGELKLSINKNYNIII